jgi:hypothetical protein
LAVAHRDGKRFPVRIDEKLTAFMELEAAILSGRTLRGLRSASNKAPPIIAMMVKTFSITSSDSFNLSSAPLNKPQGPDVR